ncbi:MAG TPA: HAMP domain-containing sensor histidine kinase [Vicinamibacterales bacterium]|nr:HAMP domain-containing sensor histidine kinase [Vicinamibacterales bacterium]
MHLRIRLLLAALIVALPAALLLYWIVERVRDGDAEETLERVSAAQLTEISRESCESDPRWFLAGPRTGRPTAEERTQPDADVRLPRPSAAEMPFEFFAYDENFLGSSSASPRFPEDFKRVFRGSASVREATGRYESSRGTGLQIARLTGWSPGPCAILLFRAQPLSNHRVKGLALFTTFFLMSFAVAALAGYPIVARVRRLTKAARESARQDYSSMAPISGADEISSLGFVFNEAAADIRRRATDATDREEALRRYVTNTTEDVAQPLAALESTLADLEKSDGLPAAARDQLRQSIREAHRLVSRLTNLASVAALRTSADRSLREPIDMNALVERVVRKHDALARALDVRIEHAVPARNVVFSADPALIEQAVTNVVGNAVLYSNPGGQVQVELKGYERDNRFSLRVTDTGPGVSDEEFAGLTANRRFRGDEGRTRRPGGRGLGLAIAREVADRFGLQLDLRRPSSGGFEVQLG